MALICRQLSLEGVKVSGQSFLANIPVNELLSVGAKRQLDVKALLARQLGGHALRLARVVVAVLALPRPRVLLVLRRVAHAHRPCAAQSDTLHTNTNITVQTKSLQFNKQLHTPSALMS